MRRAIYNKQGQLAGFIRQQRGWWYGWCWELKRGYGPMPSKEAARSWVLGE